MLQTFETEKNKKALLYTAGICGLLLLLFILISWRVAPPTPPVVQDLIEINLGNLDEGLGKIQPLKKGERGPSSENFVPAKSSPQTVSRVEPDDKAEETAAPVVRQTKAVKSNTDGQAAEPTPKPQKPKLTYNGPGNNTGNNPTEDNGYRYQGNNPGGKGDAGDPQGNKDSYGNSPGGRIGGGPLVTKGNRKIIRYYSFTGERARATVYAIIRVSAAGKGTFVGFDKGSTTRERAYADDISQYLQNMQFDRSDKESMVTVQFNFNTR